MPLELLKIYNARNLKEYTLTPHPCYNILYGANGVGKTTILESVYLLLRSRTFRSSKYKSFINYDSNDCTVFSRFSHCQQNDPLTTDSSSFNLGISRSKDSLSPVFHLNAKKVNSLSDITNLVILGLITPESFNLLDAGPSIRRKFIDWGVFHVEQSFLSDWKSYKKILTSRNNILKKLASQYNCINDIPKSLLDNLLCWSPQLIQLNNKLHKLRFNQVENIASIFKQYVKIFSKQLAEQTELKYYQGWNKDLSYAEYLSSKLDEDFLAGYTRYGTHRGEVRIFYNNRPAKDVLSRGQKKIIVISLILAQFTYLIKHVDNTKQSLLLLDDINSELDESNLQLLFSILDSINTQVLVTTTNKDKFTFLKEDVSKLFHVEH